MRAVFAVAVGWNGNLLRLAPKRVKDDDNVVSKAVLRNGKSLKFASSRLRSKAGIVLKAVTTTGSALKYASDENKDDEKIVSVALGHDATNLRFASQRLREREDLILKAVVEDYNFLKYVPAQKRMEPETIRAVVKANGMCLKYASEELRSEKDCVLAAVENNPASLKFALDGLNQNPDCLVAAGIWDPAHHEETIQRPLIVLSTRFSLDESSTSTATEFTVLLRRHPYIKEVQNFIVYSPNAFNKRSCDPNWTDMDWPCRGTTETCKMDHKSAAGPTNNSCWRYSFRCKLQKASIKYYDRTMRGCMIQVVEFDPRNGMHDGGKGQKIELDIAASVGVKVFQIYQPTKTVSKKQKPLRFEMQDINILVKHMQDWYNGRCLDMDPVKVKRPTQFVYDPLDWDGVTLFF